MKIAYLLLVFVCTGCVPIRPATMSLPDCEPPAIPDTVIRSEAPVETRWSTNDFGGISISFDAISYTDDQAWAHISLSNVGDEPGSAFQRPPRVTVNGNAYDASSCDITSSLRGNYAPGETRSGELWMPYGNLSGYEVVIGMENLSPPGGYSGWVSYTVP